MLFGGAGLGLSIINASIEQHDGRIGFKNRVGEGTTLYIVDPLGREVTQPIWVSVGIRLYY